MCHGNYIEPYFNFESEQRVIQFPGFHFQISEELVKI